MERHGRLGPFGRPADAAHGRHQGILNEVWKHKLIFVETPDANETSIALENYRRVRPAGPRYLLITHISNPGM